MRHRGILWLGVMIVVWGLNEAWGAPWILVGFDRYRDALYLDEGRVKKTADGTYDVWVRVTLAPQSLFRKRIAPDMSRAGLKVHQVKYMELRQEVNCRIGKMRPREVIYYGYDDRILSKSSGPRGRWKMTPPGTLYHGLYRTICEGASPRAPLYQAPSQKEP